MTIDEVQSVQWIDCSHYWTGDGQCLLCRRQVELASAESEKQA